MRFTKYYLLYIFQDLLKYLSWLLSYAPASPQTADVEDIPSLSQVILKFLEAVRGKNTSLKT